jgi:hypothetical protein
LLSKGATLSQPSGMKLRKLAEPNTLSPSNQIGTGLRLTPSTV